MGNVGKHRKASTGIVLFLILLVAVGGIYVVVRYSTQEKPVYLYLVRHGQTETNVQGLYVAGEGNAPLTSQGTEDARMLGLGLSETEFEAVYCSSLDRTYDTAENILKQNKGTYTIERVAELRDISVGQVEGCLASDVNEKYGDIFGAVSDAEFVSPVGAESRYRYCERFDSALSNIAKQYVKDGGNVLVVSHSSLGFWLQKKFPDEATGGGVDNCSVSIVKYINGEWELVSMNDTSYLGKGKEVAENTAPLRILIIANAQTIHERNGMIEGQTDSVLTQEGRKAAKELGEKMELTNVRAVYCSTLNRSEEMKECMLTDWNGEHSRSQT